MSKENWIGHSERNLIAFSSEIGGRNCERVSCQITVLSRLSCVNHRLRHRRSRHFGHWAVLYIRCKHPILSNVVSIVPSIDSNAGGIVDFDREGFSVGHGPWVLKLRNRKLNSWRYHRVAFQHIGGVLVLKPCQNCNYSCLGIYLAVY